MHNALYEELAKGSFLPATRAKFQAAIADLVTRGAEVIILACTEFGMLVKAEDSPVPIIDTVAAGATDDVCFEPLGASPTPPDVASPDQGACELHRDREIGS